MLRISLKLFGTRSIVPAAKHGRVTCDRKYDTWRKRSPQAPWRYRRSCKACIWWTVTPSRSAAAASTASSRLTGSPLASGTIRSALRPMWSRTASGRDASAIVRHTRHYYDDRSHREVSDEPGDVDDRDRV